MFKKIINVNSILSIAFTFSFLVSCQSVNLKSLTNQNYASYMMHKTENLAKQLLAFRSENLNRGASTPAYIMYELNDKDYDGKLGQFQEDAEKANVNFDPNIGNMGWGSAYNLLLTGLTGDIEEKNYNSFNIEPYDWEYNKKYSSIIDYSVESGPMRTYFASNLGLRDGNDSVKLFDKDNGKFATNIFTKQYNRYDSWNDNSYNDVKSLKFGDATTEGFKISLSNKSVINAGKFDATNVKNQDMIKQLRSFNDIYRLKSLINSKNDTNNLFKFLNELFAINNPSTLNIFNNLFGSIFTKTYLSNGFFSLRSVLFEPLLNKQNFSKIKDKRKQITEKMYKWYESGFKNTDNEGHDFDKAWKNGRAGVDMKSSICKKFEVGNGEESSLTELIHSLLIIYKDFFKNSSLRDLKEMTKDFYEEIKSVIDNPLVSVFLDKSWFSIIENILVKLDVPENSDKPGSKITFEDFILGILGIFDLSSDESLTIDDSSKIKSFEDIANADLNNEKDMYEIKRSLGYKEGVIIKGSIFDRLFNMFNDKNSYEYKMMDAIFLSDTGAIRSVIKEFTDYIKDNSINALFSKPVMGMDVNWKFSNPKYDQINRTVSYDVIYSGPGDSSVDLDLHRKPIISKQELDECEPVLHTDKNTGIWDKLLNKLDSDTDTYNIDWFTKYDGRAQNYTDPKTNITDNTYKQTQNTYRISFTDVAQQSYKSTWALSDIKWSHNGVKYYNLFE